MDQIRRPITIVVAEDDSDDQLMIREAFERCPPCEVHFVEDGEELLAYLRREGDFAHLRGKKLPCVVLLDLNMPKMNGQEALREIKTDPKLELIPVVVFTTSRAEEDIFKSYNLGVNSFITKPVDFDSVIATLHEYWTEVVTLPTDENLRRAFASMA